MRTFFFLWMVANFAVAFAGIDRMVDKNDHRLVRLGIISGVIEIVIFVTASINGWQPFKME